MTTAQLQTLNVTLRRIESKIDRVEDRLRYEFPWDHEFREDMERELTAMLSPGASIAVFADD